MTHPYDSVLTVVLPSSLEEEMLDYLLAHPEWADGFSVAHGEGIGKGATLASAMEKVRGRARRSIVSVLMQKENVEALLEGLKREFPSPDISWWTTSLTGSGRFA